MIAGFSKIVLTTEARESSSVLFSDLSASVVKMPYRYLPSVTISLKSAMVENSLQ